MDFAKQVKDLSDRVPDLLGYIKTEAATRNALVEPFIRALGYDTSNPSEVVPEFGADLDVPGVAKDKKVDYAICKDGKPIILIECKCHTDKLSGGYKQLFHYAVATNCQIGILTNGLIYRFYAALDKPNTSCLDNTPFLEVDLRSLKNPLPNELQYLTKSSFDVKGMLTAATDLKYVGGILQILTEQFNSPSDDFVKFFFQRVCEGKTFAGGVKQEFANYTKQALEQFIRDRINDLMEISLEKKPPTTDDVPPPAINDIYEPITKSNVITTDEELEGFYIVKSILYGVVSSDRIFHRDVASYFGILLDNNKLKPICRLHFNNSQNKQICLFDWSENGKQQERLPIKTLDDIYQHSDRLKATVAYYLSGAEAPSQLDAIQDD